MGRSGEVLVGSASEGGGCTAAAVGIVPMPRQRPVVDPRAVCRPVGVHCGCGGVECGRMCWVVDLLCVGGAAGGCGSMVHLGGCCGGVVACGCGIGWAAAFPT